MSTSRIVSFRHVPCHFAYLDSACYVRISRYVDGRCTGSCYFDVKVSGGYLGQGESDFLHIVEALGKRLRLSGHFTFATILSAGTLVEEDLDFSIGYFQSGQLLSFGDSSDAAQYVYSRFLVS